MQGLHDYDPDTVGSPEVPGVCVAADEAQPRSDMSRFHEMFPDILCGKTVGSGHFCQLEVPEQINAMIDRFLTIALATAMSMQERHLQGSAEPGCKLRWLTRPGMGSRSSPVPPS
jgi:hypothetical protein